MSVIQRCSIDHKGFWGIFFFLLVVEHASLSLHSAAFRLLKSLLRSAAFPKAVLNHVLLFPIKCLVFMYNTGIFFFPPNAGSEFLSILKWYFFSCQEMGGYFIINGLEKVIRMLIMPRRNFPLAMMRHKWKNRGPGFTEYGKLSSFLQHPGDNCLRTNRSDHL